MKITNQINNVDDNIIFVPDRVSLQILTNSEWKMKAKSNNLDNHISPGGRGGDMGVFTLGMKAGGTYKLSVKVNVLETLSSPINPMALTVGVDVKIDGEIHWNYFLSNYAENQIGDWLIELSFTVPKDASGAWIRLQGGMNSSKGEIIWHDFRLTSCNENELVPINKNARTIDHWSETTYGDAFSEFKKAEKIFNKDFNQGKKYLSENKLIDWYKGIDVNYFVNPHQRNLTVRAMEYSYLFDYLEEIQRGAFDIEKGQIELDFVPVFVWWAQGIETAPEIVKILVRRMKNMYGSRLIILNEENIKYWLQVPHFMNNVSNNYRAHYSDYLRVSLLAKYGGIYFDATVYISSKDMLDEMWDNMNNDQYIVQTFSDPYRISSWFMMTNQVRRPFAVVQAALQHYWSNFDVLSEYFMIHTFWEILSQIDESFSYYQKKSQKFNANKGLRLEKVLYDNFSESQPIVNQITEEHPVHKLSYHTVDFRRILPDSVLSDIIRKA